MSQLTISPGGSQVWSGLQTHSRLDWGRIHVPTHVVAGRTRWLVGCGDGAWVPRCLSETLRSSAHGPFHVQLTVW